jgi:hypothetical protein
MPAKKDERLERFQGQIDATKQYTVDQAIQKLRRQLDSEKAQHKVTVQDLTTALTKLDAIGFVEDRGVTVDPIEPLLPSGEGEATAVGVLSDVHPFTRIRPETVNGKNEFNPDICRARLKKFFQGLLSLTNIERSGQKVNRLLLFLGGDITGNMIHDELKETNYGTPQEEVLFMLDQLETGIEFLLEHGGFDEIRVVGSHGNHDRDTKKKQFENQAEHALTWTLYHVLKRDLERRHKNLKMDVAVGYHHILPIYGRKVRLHHGDSVRYSGGVGGPTIAINKAISVWNQTDPVDLDIFGHMHWSMSDQRFFCNGSVCGYSTYALANKFPFEVPRQWFLLLDKKRWLTSQRYIYLD